jgi:hypothetical protein
VQALLAPYPAEPRTARFHNIERPMTVLRIGMPDTAAAAA